MLVSNVLTAVGVGVGVAATGGVGVAVEGVVLVGVGARLQQLLMSTIKLRSHLSLEILFPVLRYRVDVADDKICCVVQYSTRKY
jgi:hypothetical protein